MKHIRFCQKMMTFFENNSKSILNLVLALANNHSGHSPTELSLNPLYMYKYSSICDAIDNMYKEEKDPLKTPDKKLQKIFENESELRDFLKEFLPDKNNVKFWTLNTDVSSIYREYSPTLENREFVHCSNTVIASNKPVTIGVRLSTVGLSVRENNIAWNLPISMLKVPVELKNSEFAAQQIKVIISENDFFENNLVVNDLDSAYCNIGYVYPTNDLKNLVSIIRIAGNRNVFHRYKGQQKIGSGRKNQYGKIFKLPDNKTYTTPDKCEEFEFTLKNKKECKVVVRQWNDMIIRGKQKKSMYDKPFNLIAIQLFDIQTKKPLFEKILWLTVWGQRRKEITLREIYESYRKRFDIEFFFRFGKQNLMLDKFQTTNPRHLQNWFWIVMLSYWLLYLSRKEGENIIRPWEKYDIKYKNQDVKELENKIVKTPTQTQRTMQSIFSDFAKNNLIPKPSKNPQGRKKGTIQKPKIRYKVVKKGDKLQI